MICQVCFISIHIDKINGNKGAIILASMLKTNQTITTLYLSSMNSFH
jgi:hypothetical protein